MTLFDIVCMYMIHVVLQALKSLPQTIYVIGLMATVNPASGIEMEDLPMMNMHMIVNVDMSLHMIIECGHEKEFEHAHAWGYKSGQ